ncbi:MAG: hypothetical protein JKP98_08660 [Rhodobacteraceae bacterium]|nr:hypothetical protein [Paracoccaceae bacterium]
MPVKEKAALLVPSGTYHEPDKKHLHIICSDPDAKGLVVIVGISTYTNDLCDQTCVLQAHEHPWLRHQSFCSLSESGNRFGRALQARIQSGEVLECDEVNAQTFLRIKKGLCKSPQTKRKVKRYLGC